MAAGNVNRSRDRSATVVMRVSPEDKQELVHRATEAGLSVQIYLESLAFNRPPQPRPNGLNAKLLGRSQQELPISA